MGISYHTCALHTHPRLESTEEKDTKSQRTGRKAERCHFLEMTQSLCTLIRAYVAICTSQNELERDSEVPPVSKKALVGKGCFGRDSQSSLVVYFLRGCPVQWTIITHSYTHGQHQLDSYLKDTRSWRDDSAIKSTYFSCRGPRFNSQHQYKAAHTCKPASGNLKTLAFPVYACHTHTPQNLGEPTVTVFLNQSISNYILNTYLYVQFTERERQRQRERECALFLANKNHYRKLQLNLSTQPLSIPKALGMWLKWGQKDCKSQRTWRLAVCQCILYTTGTP